MDRGDVKGIVAGFVIVGLGGFYGFGMTHEIKRENTLEHDQQMAEQFKQNVKKMNLSVSEMQELSKGMFEMVLEPDSNGNMNPVFYPLEK